MTSIPEYFMETSTTNTVNITPKTSIEGIVAASQISDEFSTNLDWYTNVIEEDSFYSPIPFDASESGLWNGRFVPPPPRPPFWDDSITSDGLTTCDLCTWALHERKTFSLDGSISGEFLLNTFWFFYFCFF